MIHGFLASLLGVPNGWACGDETPEGSCTCDDAQEVDVATLDPGGCAKRVELVGAGNCSWTTTMMAERVLDEGAPYTYVGHLAEGPNRLTSRVAAPFTVGPGGEISVIANEVVDLLVRQGAVERRLELRGRVLEVDGVKYLAITEFILASS